ncbi:MULTISPECIES: hypothetical protein [Exiguobacterium]|uniref:hypothetical protein n=1 Tax=Exiguobacterium TaxID=33986 RepID=UPI0006820F36|nr:MULTISPECIES: hypothetical protein [Exiguobacterium]KNH34263.1 hypothetical protein ACS74_10320 [Exiguobacterium acetylicum]OAI89585.1 hypothetical protein AYO36_05385 [Exiguobacterium sp. KKBO11]
MARRKFQALGVYKRVHINPETRRMTLPEPFYDALRLEDELLIAQVGDVLVMRRPGEVVETETELLSELVEDGFTGTELVQEFAYRRQQQEQRLRQQVLQDEEDDHAAQLKIEL